MKNTFTGIFEKVGDWYIGYAEELPGANSQGKTLKEVRSNLREAIQLVLNENRKLIKKNIHSKDFIREEIKVAV
jgi:predicted RNase H-like HicB family nuclease